MKRFTRSQVLKAISVTLGQGPTPGEALKTDAKRLLDTDRRLERRSGSKNPEVANYAFFSGEAPGSGVEVYFSSYEVFALRLAVGLLQQEWPQATAVRIMRQLRSILETKHSEILRWNPAQLFDREKVKAAAKPGDLAVDTTRPTYLAISSLKGRPAQNPADQTREVAVLENGELMPFIRREAGRYFTVIELTKLAHELQAALAKTKPSKRGRTSS